MDIEVALAHFDRLCECGSTTARPKVAFQVLGAIRSEKLEDLSLVLDEEVS